MSTGGQPLGIGRKVHRLDDVLVGEGHQFLPGDGIPHLGAEVAGGRRGQVGPGVQPARPHGPLVALPRPDPVAGGAVAHHGTFVVAGRDEEGAGRAAGLVGGRRRIDVGDGGELKFGQRSGVTRADDGDLSLSSLLGAAHCYVLCFVLVYCNLLGMFRTGSRMGRLTFFLCMCCKKIPPRRYVTAALCF